MGSCDRRRVEALLGLGWLVQRVALCKGEMTTAFS